MALIVLGAGATRGASFVDPAKFPCLPPLDRDFFTQLQRVGNPKHRDLLRMVMAEVVDLFGVNFDARMETVFSTLEHTIRMLEITGDNREYRAADLKRMRDNLLQAIAVVLEESLSVDDGGGHSSHRAKTCEYHMALVRDILQPRDEIISFNYDCLIDFALRDAGDYRWNARYGYSVNLGPRGKYLEGDQFWQPKSPAPEPESIRLYKLHGSLSFQVREGKGHSNLYLKQRPYTKQKGRSDFTIIPPEWHKAYNKGFFSKLWQDAASAISRHDSIVFVGYSLPETDLHASALFRTSRKNKPLSSLVIVDPNQPTRKRIRSVFQKSIDTQTKVLSFDYMKEFVACPRDLWT